MKIAGLDVDSADVPELAQHLRREGCGETGDGLEGALMAGVKRVGLTIEERDDVLRALQNCPDELTELRARLLQEHIGRQRDGLV